MSDEGTIGTLSARDASYLRRADTVYAIRFEGQNYLRCVKRGDWQDAFSQDMRVDIPVQGNGSDGFFTSAWSFPWGTLRAGDTVSLYWYPDAGTNQYLRDAGLHTDHLYVDVTRGKRTVRYLVTTGTTPDNSARMCRADSVHVG